jgi:hypothetical protein
MSDNRELKHVGRQRDDDGNQYNESMKRNKSLKSWGGGGSFRRTGPFRRGGGTVGNLPRGPSLRGAPQI